MTTRNEYRIDAGISDLERAADQADSVGHHDRAAALRGAANELRTASDDQEMSSMPGWGWTVGEFFSRRG